ncbi:hypothetical protein MIND_00697900 [Mycena indigotica]|uniref:Uncharacterized protein n=1 Tax=Mycena indigotica TaxID=2126181 RepID=A0A8H6SLQ5_9AGAR|nr:uncharacterized protein MIND_00697900 [Mycena indigotica]KAF7301328.1 hypothetical protein MIND_00697900 [Mycena indigotica]
MFATCLDSFTEALWTELHPTMVFSGFTMPDDGFGFHLGTWDPVRNSTLVHSGAVAQWYDEHTLETYEHELLASPSVVPGGGCQGGPAVMKQTNVTQVGRQLEHYRRLAQLQTSDEAPTATFPPDMEIRFGLILSSPSVCFVEQAVLETKNENTTSESALLVSSVDRLAPWAGPIVALWFAMSIPQHDIVHPDGSVTRGVPFPHMVNLASLIHEGTTSQFLHQLKGEQTVEYGTCSATHSSMSNIQDPTSLACIRLQALNNVNATPRYLTYLRPVTLDYSQSKSRPVTATADDSDSHSEPDSPTSGTWTTTWTSPGPDSPSILHAAHGDLLLSSTLIKRNVFRGTLNMQRSAVTVIFKTYPLHRLSSLARESLSYKKLASVSWVPKCFGTFRPNTIANGWIGLILEDLGDYQCPPWDDLEPSHRHSLYALLCGLHDHGICHGSFAPRNVVLRGGEWYLIDFERAVVDHECAGSTCDELVQARKNLKVV